MQNLGWIPAYTDKIEQLRAVLSFFGVVSPIEWEQIWLHSKPAFRQSQAFEANQMAVAAWLRKGEIDAQQLVCAPYDKQRFRSVLQQIRTLTATLPSGFQSEVVQLCADSGVAVVFVPALPKTGISGATRWLTPDKALLQLSLRYKTDDQLWFTFFHEAGHILNHRKRDVFIETVDGDACIAEEEADRFAANSLIPQVEWQRFARENYHYSKREIQHFASQIGIAPGIVVGRLQKEGLLPHSHCNDLKRYFTWEGNTVQVKS